VRQCLQLRFYQIDCALISHLAAHFSHSTSLIKKTPVEKNRGRSTSLCRELWYADNAECSRYQPCPGYCVIPDDSFSLCKRIDSSTMSLRPAPPCCSTCSSKARRMRGSQKRFKWREISSSDLLRFFRLSKKSPI